MFASSLLGANASRESSLLSEGVQPFERASPFEAVVSSVVESDEEEGVFANCQGEGLASATSATLSAPVRKVALPMILIVAGAFAASMYYRSNRQALPDGRLRMARDTERGLDELQDKARPNIVPMERLEMIDDSETLSCSQRGLVYQPVDMHRETMTREPSIAHCQARCSRTHGCTRFAYFAPTGDCHLQDAFAAPSYQNPNWISGPSACSMRGRSMDILATLLRKEICYEVGVAYYRLDMEGTELSWEDSVLDCQRRCRAMPGCAHFSYNSNDGSCHLQDGKANAVSNPHSGMIAGPPSCQIPRQRMIEIMMVDPTDADSMSSSLLPPSAARKGETADDAFALSCADYNAAHTGEPLEGQPMTHERGVSECQARCAAARGCAAFSFDVRRVSCHLFGAEAAKVAEARSGWVSGPPACSRSAGPRALSAATVLMRSGACFERDTSYNVLDMPGSPPTRADSVFDCQRRCRDTAACAHFTYESVDGMCHLEAASAEPISDPDSRLIAGTPVCKVAADQLLVILMQIEAAVAEARASGRTLPSPPPVGSDGAAAAAPGEGGVGHGVPVAGDGAAGAANSSSADGGVGKSSSATAATGACAPAGDSAKWYGGGHKNFQTDMDACGKPCLGGGACVADCFHKKGYTKPCAKCFGDATGCAVSHCLFQCMGGASPGCLACTKEQCRPGFLECSGFPQG